MVAAATERRVDRHRGGRRDHAGGLYAGDPVTSPQRFEKFLKTGMDVAKGGSGRGEDATA